MAIKSCGYTPALMRTAPPRQPAGVRSGDVQKFSNETAEWLLNSQASLISGCLPVTTVSRSLYTAVRRGKPASLMTSLKRITYCTGDGFTRPTGGISITHVEVQMGSMKELMFEMQQEKADEWIEENYPDAEEGTPEWEIAAQNYGWMLDDLAEQAEWQWFQDSLNDLDDRYIHAVHELDELKELVNSAQAGIVFRMAYAHTVTVMEAFMMYSARALLNDLAHLDRFYKHFASNTKVKGALRKCSQAVLENTQKHPDGWTPDDTLQHRRTAQLYVSQQTFLRSC